MILSRPLADGGISLPKRTLLPPGHDLSSKSSSFPRQRPASVHAVTFTDGSGFDVPSDVSPYHQHLTDRYTAAVHAIQADPRKFSSSSECVVCEGTGHPFAECEVLQDVEYLKKHHITFCVNQRRMRKMLATRAAVHWLHTTQADDDAEPPAPDFR